MECTLYLVIRFQRALDQSDGATKITARAAKLFIRKRWAIRVLLLIAQQSVIERETLPVRCASSTLPEYATDSSSIVRLHGLR